MFLFFTPQKTAIAIRDKVIERLGTFSEIAKGSSITLCHENEKGIYGDILSVALKFIRHSPEMKAIFDPANYVQCEVDTLKGVGNDKALH